MALATRRSSRIASASSKKLPIQNFSPFITAAGKSASDGESPAPLRGKRARTVTSKAMRTNKGTLKTLKDLSKKTSNIGGELEPPPRKRARTSTTNAVKRTRAADLKPVESKAQHKSEKDSSVSQFADPVVDEPQRRPISAQEDGCLARLFDLPPELIDEVFSHLHPLDLLHLSRATKHLRSMLLSRAAAFLWRRCMLNVPEHPRKPGVPDLPPKPDNVNEPQWANLLYGKVGCYRCPSHIANFVSWQTNQRLCKKCIDASFVSIQQFHGFSIIPYHNIFQREQHAKAILPYYSPLPIVSPFTGCSAWRGCAPPRYCWEIARQYEQEWLAQALVAVKQGNSPAKESETGDKSRDSGTGGKKQVTQKVSYANWKPWVKEKKARLDALIKHERLCEKWAKRELERKCDQRERAVIKRLTDLGLGDAVARLPPGALGSLRGVRTEHPLSEESWSNIKSRIISYVRRMRDKRLQKEKEGESVF